jgi:uncharacterized protein (TIGR02646 family)
MLYIKKTQPSQELIDWLNIEKESGRLYPHYNSLQTSNSTASSFKAYQSLRKQLHDEQRGLCCYCMKRVTTDNSNVEHFLPQSIFPENEVDYYNLYLACRYSHGKREEEQYCDIAKGNKLIGKYIGYVHTEKGVVTKCEDLLQYTEDGYVLPNKTGFKTLQKFHQSYASLTSQEKELLATIAVLNLNCNSLVNDRVKFIADTKAKIDSITDAERLNKMILFYKTEPIAFAGVALYFLQERLKTL